MRKIFAVVVSSLLLGIVLFGFLSTSPLADDATKAEKVWEYKVVENPSDASLTEIFGKKGWEAFAVVNDKNDQPTVWLKRPKP